jgi:hypothetical protein
LIGINKNSKTNGAYAMEETLIYGNCFVDLVEKKKRTSQSMETNQLKEF